MIERISRHPRKILLAALTAVCLLLALLLVRRLQGTDTAAVETRRLVDVVYGLATVEANQIFHLRLGINARIEKMYVREGMTVRAGAPLVRFDSIPIASAPITGVVTALNYREGETVFASQAILTVTNLEDVVLQMGLEERAAAKIRKGQNVRLVFDALGKTKFAGSVESVFPDNAQFLVRINPPAPLPEGILPGMTADVAIETAAGEALVVPAAALPADRPEELLVVRAGKIVRVPVEIDLRDESGVFVRGDVRPGEIVVLGEDSAKD